MIIEGILHKKDVTRFCTSRITDMSNLFTEMEIPYPPNTTFNQDISTWM